jgi:putative ABC transport system permease protein
MASAGSPEERIVGVVSDFRKNGELSAAAGFAIYRADPRTPGAHDSENILIRFRPGTAPGGEARILAALSTVGRDWSFEIRPLSEMRTLANQALLVRCSARSSSPPS